MGSRRKTLLQVALGVAIAGGICIVLGTGSGDSSADGTRPGSILIVAGAWTLVLCGAALPGALRALRSGPLAPRGRMDRAGLVAFAATLAGPCALFLLFQEYNAWTADLAGFPPGRAVEGLLAGYLAYLPLVVGSRIVQSALFGEAGSLRAFVRGNGRVVPRSPALRPAMWGLLLVNPFVEEVWYRGILVFLLGNWWGSPAAAVAAGLPVCLLLHAYQGRRPLFFHAGFYAVAVALLYSPGGLWASIGLHVAGDLLPVLGLRATARTLRAVRADRWNMDPRRAASPEAVAGARARVRARRRMAAVLGLVAVLSGTIALLLLFG